MLVRACQSRAPELEPDFGQVSLSKTSSAGDRPEGGACPRSKLCHRRDGSDPGAAAVSAAEAAAEAAAGAGGSAGAESGGPARAGKKKGESPPV